MDDYSSVTEQGKFFILSAQICIEFPVEFKRNRIPTTQRQISFPLGNREVCSFYHSTRERNKSFFCRALTLICTLLLREGVFVSGKGGWRAARRRCAEKAWGLGAKETKEQGVAGFRAPSPLRLHAGRAKK